MGISVMRGRVTPPIALSEIPPLAVPGAHNRANAALAAATTTAAGCPAQAIETGLRHYKGLPHRLELVGNVDGREFYNDSMATTPESAIAALLTFSGRCWLLVGGYDKGIDMSSLLAALPRHACGVAFYGAIGPRLHAQWYAGQSVCRVTLSESLDDALDWCWRHSHHAGSDRSVTRLRQLR